MTVDRDLARALTVLVGGLVLLAAGIWAGQGGGAS